MRGRHGRYDHSADAHCDRHGNSDYNVRCGEEAETRFRSGGWLDELWKDVMGCGMACG
jgi:hypothetical protein